jgi:hypothetical protein
VFRLLEIYRPFSRPATSALDSIPNIGFPRSRMTAQLYVARESDAPAMLGSRRRIFVFVESWDANTG